MRICLLHDFSAENNLILKNAIYITSLEGGLFIHIMKEIMQMLSKTDGEISAKDNSRDYR